MLSGLSGGWADFGKAVESGCLVGGAVATRPLLGPASGYPVFRVVGCLSWASPAKQSTPAGPLG